MKSRRIIFGFCLLSLLASGSAGAQEDEVRAAVSATLAALVARDVSAFASFYHNDTRGDVEGGPISRVPSCGVSYYASGRTRESHDRRGP